jgi:hypothetical protein
MEPGDLVEWNYGKYRLSGIIVKKSDYFGWDVYIPKINKINQLSSESLRKIQQITEEK